MFGFTTKYLLNSASRVFDPQRETSRYTAPRVCPPIPSYAPLPRKPCMNFPGVSSSPSRKSVWDRQVELEGAVDEESFDSG